MSNSVNNINNTSNNNNDNNNNNKKNNDNNNNGVLPPPPSSQPMLKLQAFLTKPSDVSSFVLGDWNVKTVKDRIMQSSACAHQHFSPCCDVCSFDKHCSVPSLPDMVFSKNTLLLKHRYGPKIEFKALNALAQVTAGKSDSNIKVAATEEWLSSRSDHLQNVKADVDYDWTYSSKYKGDATGFEIANTSDRIDLDALRQREPILFYDELRLYEDELDDHGCAVMSIRVRCMPSGYFVLLRYHLRVDSVFVRIYDTRVRWCKTQPAVVLREWTAREAKWHELTPAQKRDIMQPDLIWQQLPIVDETYEKLTVPPSCSSTTTTTSISTPNTTVSASGSSKNNLQLSKQQTDTDPNDTVSNIISHYGNVESGDAKKKSSPPATTTETTATDTQSSDAKSTCSLGSSDSGATAAAVHSIDEEETKTSSLSDSLTGVEKNVKNEL